MPWTKYAPRWENFWGRGVQSSRTAGAFSGALASFEGARSAKRAWPTIGSRVAWIAKTTHGTRTAGRRRAVAGARLAHLQRSCPNHFGVGVGWAFRTRLRDIRVFELACWARLADRYHFTRHLRIAPIALTVHNSNAARRRIGMLPTSLAGARIPRRQLHRESCSFTQRTRHGPCCGLECAGLACSAGPTVCACIPTSAFAVCLDSAPCGRGRRRGTFSTRANRYCPRIRREMINRTQSAR